MTVTGVQLFLGDGEMLHGESRVTALPRVYTQELIDVLNVLIGDVLIRTDVDNLEEIVPLLHSQPCHACYDALGNLRLAQSDLVGDQHPVMTLPEQVIYPVYRGPLEILQHCVGLTVQVIDIKHRVFHRHFSFSVVLNVSYNLSNCSGTTSSVPIRRRILSTSSNFDGFS